MNRWITKKIADIADVVAGGTPSTNNSEFWNGDIGWITPADLSGYKYRYIANGARNISSAGLNNSSAYLLPKNTVLLSSRAPIGYVAIAEKELATNQGFKNLICDDTQVDYRFMYYWLQLNADALKSFASGATFPELSAGTVKKIKVTLPDIVTQNRIADILSTYDDLIESNNRRIELLEQTAQELYKEWFVRFRFPGYENVKLEDGFPKGWTIKRLADYGRVETGKTPSTEIVENYGGEMMFVKTPDMHGNMFIIQTEDKLSERGHNTQPKKLLPANSIMVSCIGTAGVVSINAEPAHTNQQINSIVLNNPNELEWLYHTCKSLKETIELFGATGATMTNLSKGKFEKLKVVDPGEDLILAYHNKVKPLFDEIKSLMYQNQNLAAQRDMLLPRLMSGKLEV